MSRPGVLELRVCPMKILLSALQEGVPKAVHEVYDPKKMELELVDLKFLEDLKLEGTLLKEAMTVSFKGHLRSKVRRICGKTLAEVDEPLDVPFDLYFEIGDRETIDTVDDLREAVLLAQPMVYYAPGSETKEVSYEDKEPTGDKKREADSAAKENNPFAKLKKLRDRLKEE